MSAKLVNVPPSVDNAPPLGDTVCYVSQRRQGGGWGVTDAGAIQEVAQVTVR